MLPVGPVGLLRARSVAVLVALVMAVSALGPAGVGPVTAKKPAATRTAAGWGCGRPPKVARPDGGKPRPSPSPDPSASPLPGDPSPSRPPSDPGPSASAVPSSAPVESQEPDPATPEPTRKPAKTEPPAKDPPKEKPTDPPTQEPPPTPEPTPEPPPEPPAPDPSAAAQPMLAVAHPRRATTADEAAVARWLTWVVRSALPWVHAGIEPPIPALIGAPVDLAPEPPPPARPAPAGWTRGLDISHWNGAVDLGAVKDAGYAFVIVKATQGTYFTDALFTRNVAAARAAGLALGAYHFYDYRQKGAAQARHFLATLDAQGLLAEGIPPVVDVECFKPFGPARQSIARRELRAFSDTLFAATGRLPMIYTSGHMWHEITADDPTFGDHPLWVACWRCPQPYLPSGWSRWVTWQVGSMAVPGRSTRLDGNIVPPGRAGMVGLAADPITVPARTRSTAVSIRVRTAPGTLIRTSTDGGPWSPWRRATLHQAVPVPGGDGRHDLRVQLRSQRGTLGPVRRFPVLRDATPPTLTVTQVGPALQSDATTETLTVTVHVNAHDATTGIDRTHATLTCDGTTERAGDALLRLHIPAGHACSVQVAARDALGNVRTVETALDLRLDRLPDAATDDRAIHCSLDAAARPC